MDGASGRLRSIDLNLLTVFVEIMRHRNITAAAAALGLAQPSVSNALSRLRVHFDDPLFVRTPGGMEPSQLALDLAAPIAEALDSIQNTLDRGADFAPGTTRRTFRLVETDLGENIFLPALVGLLRDEAPLAGIASLSMSREQYREALESGLADLALGQIPYGQTQLIQQHLFDDQLVCLARGDHPIFLGDITLESFLAARHLSITQPSNCEVLIRRALGRKAALRDIQVQVPHWMTVPQLLARSDLIAVVPNTFARTILPAAANETRTFAVPFEIEPIRVYQFWHRRMHNDAGHRWLRQGIASLFGGRGAPSIIDADGSARPLDPDRPP